MEPFYDWEGNPITAVEWSRLFEDERHIGDDKLDVDGEEVWVSTVWMGLDHRFMEEGPPLIYETMIFGGPLDDETWRYSTEREAREGHARAVERARSARPNHVQHPGN